MILKLLFPLLLVCCLKFTKRQIQKIKQSHQITALGSSQLADYEVQQKCCFSIQIEDKNKRKGYSLMKRKFEAVRRYLSLKGLIPETNLLRPSKSEVRINHNRKVWSFKRVICFLTQHRQGEVESILEKQGIKHIKFQPTQQLNQYDYITKAFIDAKKKVEQFLDTIQYRIKGVKNVKILSDQLSLVEYHESLYSQIEYESSKSNQEKSEEKSNDDQDESQSEEEEIRHVELEVTFEIQSLDQFVDESSDDDERIQNAKQSKQQMSDQL